MQAVRFFSSNQRTRDICEVSRDTIMRDSFSGHSKAPLTLVPPPNTIMTTLFLTASEEASWPLFPLNNPY